MVAPLPFPAQSSSNLRELEPLIHAGRQLVADMRLYLDEVEPMRNERSVRHFPWFADFEETLHATHLLWTRLEQLESSLRFPGESH